MSGGVTNVGNENSRSRQFLDALVTRREWRSERRRLNTREVAPCQPDESNRLVPTLATIRCRLKSSGHERGFLPPTVSMYSHFRFVFCIL